MKFFQLDALMHPQTGVLLQIARLKVNQDVGTKLLRMQTKLEREYKKVYMPMRDELVKEYSDNKGSINPNHPRWAEFVGPFTDLQLQDTDASISFDKIKLEELWRRENGERVPIDLSSDELRALLPVLDESELQDLREAMAIDIREQEEAAAKRRADPPVLELQA